MSNKANYKGHEKRAAATFSSKRNPFSGSSGGISRSDTLHKKLFIECKKRERHAVISLYKETAELAVKENKIPVISLKEHNTQELYFIFEEKDLFNILKEIDLSLIDEKFPAGLTLDNLSGNKENNSKLADCLHEIEIIIGKYRS